MVPELSISEIAASLFSKPPSGLLFHYTSLDAFTRIVRDGQLYASDIRYLNDSAELSHTVSLLREALERRYRAADRIGRAGGNISVMMAPAFPPEFLAFLDEMIDARGCHVVCFSKNGNQLSQWRGYCPPHRGISIGFEAQDLLTRGNQQGFALRQCIYDWRRQRRTAAALVDGMHFNAEATTDIERYKYEVFEAFQEIAATLKHPRFKEEAEYRLISQVRWGQSPLPEVDYREGKSMLIPFRRFHLPIDNSHVKIAKVVVGPTPHVRQALRAVKDFLSVQKKLAGIPQVEYCDIPLREA
jgi:hypothetical protein